MTDIEIFSNSAALSDRATELIVETALEAVAARGRFTIALTGGSSPVGVYERLSRVPLEQPRWDKWVVFLGDDRFVPPDNGQSNYGQARRTLLDHVPIPYRQIHAIATDVPTVEEAAARYAETLARVFGQPLNGPTPVFDMVLLGMGDDGHAASLFPGYPTLSVMDRWVVSSPPGTLPPPLDRVTFTFPVLNAARRVLFLVNGERKAVAVRDILGDGAGVPERPAGSVRPTSGTLTWLLDEAAASLLKKK